MTLFAERHFRGLVFAIWLSTSLLLLFVARQPIADWKMGDPDDLLRLAQIRDWLAGQSWWDIAQYRMNAPEGGPMHWSRLVDVPIAALILLFQPFFGQAFAEKAAAALVPLLTYGCILAMYAGMARRLFGPLVAIIAAGLFVTIMTATKQIFPMRIDHHGWQLFCFFAAGWALFDRKHCLRSAAIIGLAMALWIEISIEGLPFAIIFMSILGLRWLFPAFFATDGDANTDQFPVALSALAGGTAFFYLVTEGWWQSQNFCDGLSPFHVAAFISVASIIGLAALYGRITGQVLTLWTKLIVGMLAAAAGLAVVLAIAPQCTRDAFAGLDPLVRRYWYDRVPEGLPLWEIELEFSISYIFGFAFGLVGMIWALFYSNLLSKPEKLVLAMLFFACAAVGSLVSRTMVYSVCLASITLAAMAIMLFKHAEVGSNLGQRMGFRTLALVLLFPGIVSQNVWQQVKAAQQVVDPVKVKKQKAFAKLATACELPRNVALLNRIPSSQLMVGLDVSPSILQITHHKVIASGHHRNQRAMADVIRAFTGTTEEARSIMLRRNSQYLITCEGSYELFVYKRDAPRGFVTRVRQGEVPAWLVRQPDIGPFRIWRTDWTRR